MSDRSESSAAYTALREALHAATTTADTVVESDSLIAPLRNGTVIAVVVPTEEWGRLCSAIRDVLGNG